MNSKIIYVCIRGNYTYLIHQIPRVEELKRSDLQPSEFSLEFGIQVGSKTSIYNGIKPSWLKNKTNLVM